MDKIKNLDATEAAKKMKDLAEEIRVCMFFTEEGDCSPMTVAKADEAGTISFLTDKNSEKVIAIQENNMVHLVFSHPGKELYMDLHGEAFLSTDPEEIEQFWTSSAKTWFKEGKTDPSVCVIKVKSIHGKYWDTQHGKMVELFKIISSAITGGNQGNVVSGEMQLSN